MLSNPRTLGWHCKCSFSRLTNGLGFEFNHGNAAMLNSGEKSFDIYYSSIIFEGLTSGIAHVRYLDHKKTSITYYTILNVTRYR